MVGSGPGEPLPTRAGHMALWSLGNWLAGIGWSFGRVSGQMSVVSRGGKDNRAVLRGASDRKVLESTVVSAAARRRRGATTPAAARRRTIRRGRGIRRWRVRARRGGGGRRRRSGGGRARAG